MDRTITTEELKKKIDAGQGGYFLIDTHGPEKYAMKHLPTAINVQEDADFVKNLEATIGSDKNAEIITYCGSPTCQRHIRAAEMLRTAGYTNVIRYAEGIAGWLAAGYEFGQ